MAFLLLVVGFETSHTMLREGKLYYVDSQMTDRGKRQRTEVRTY